MISRSRFVAVEDDAKIVEGLVASLESSVFSTYLLLFPSCFSSIYVG